MHYLKNRFCFRTPSKIVAPIIFPIYSRIHSTLVHLSYGQEKSYMHDQLHGGIVGINKFLLSVLSDIVHARDLVLAVLGPAWQVSRF
jgi:hypothetical protein